MARAAAALAALLSTGSAAPGPAATLRGPTERVAACKPTELAIVESPLVCMPYASDGDEMKHNPSINDTLSTYRWLMAGGRGIDSACTPPLPITNPSPPTPATP